MHINWEPLEEIIRNFYQKKGYQEFFIKDQSYLKASFLEIESVWNEQLKSIESVNYILFSEAPLWGESKKYIYNPAIKQSQFFYYNDLPVGNGSEIKTKSDFINALNNLGFLILDLSPYPLNEFDTKIFFQKMSRKDYHHLVSQTIPYFFVKKLDIIQPKFTKNPAFIFRYKRVMDTFGDSISDLLIERDLIQEANEINEIAQSGGGIDRNKLRAIIK